MIKINNTKPTDMTDARVVEGLQRGEREVEHAFYLSCLRYFRECQAGVFDLAGGAREAEDVFQEAFVLLWREIQTHRIFVRDNRMWRTDLSGAENVMTSSLKTYLMGIARNKNFEVQRDEEKHGSDGSVAGDVPEREADEDMWQWIVSQCVFSMPKRCKEILTLFFYEGKSLDEILAIRQENQSKDGLKTGKYKCMKSLKGKVLEMFKYYNLRPFGYVQ